MCDPVRHTKCIQERKARASRVYLWELHDGLDLVGLSLDGDGDGVRHPQHPLLVLHLQHHLVQHLALLQGSQHNSHLHVCACVHVRASVHM